MSAPRLRLGPAPPGTGRASAFHVVAGTFHDQASTSELAAPRSRQLSPADVARYRSDVRVALAWARVFQLEARRARRLVWLLTALSWTLAGYFLIQIS